MQFHQIDAPVPGNTYVDPEDSLKNSGTVFTFDSSSRGHHLFTSVGRFFVSEKLKESIEEEGLNGVGFTEIVARGASKEVLKGQFFELTFQKGSDAVDFYLYDNGKLAASDKALETLESICGKKLEVLALDQKTDADEFMSSFKKELADGKYDNLSE